MLNFLRSVVFVFAASACQAAPTQEALVASDATDEATHQAIFFTPAGERLVKVEIADDDAERERGLMYRKQMGDDRGMLFIFAEEAQRSFWMKNTYISLDIIFLDNDLRVVGIAENAEPLTLSPRSSTEAARYVIEINAGLSKAWGIAAGTQVALSPDISVETPKP